MKANINTNQKCLSISADIHYQQIISNAGVVFYNTAEKAKLLQVIGVQVCLTDSIQVVKNDSFYWILRPCGKQGKDDIDEIQRLIGLTFTIVCIEISNALQAIIQKSFSKALNHALISNKEIKLIFIKSTYRNKLHTIEIKYCQDTPEAMSLIYQNHFFKTHPIKVFDLVQLFDCDYPQNVAKVRQVYQKYETIQRKEDEISRLNNMIFLENEPKGHVLKKIQDLHLSSQRQNKLVWKLQRLSLYKEWLEEQKQSNGVECSKYTFKDIDSKISQTAIQKYHKAWTTNSLLLLKNHFKKISDRKDITSIKHFTSQYEAMRANLQSIERDVKSLPYAYAFTIMRKQLNQFYQYHESILKEQTFGLFKYMKEQAKFQWRFNNRIYKKMAAFIILSAFAYAQGDLIKSLTVLSIAVIVLALRC